MYIYCDFYQIILKVEFNNLKYGNYLMSSIKDITERFEVTRATLHNWKTTKPKLYKYLINSDDQYEKYREVNIFLETYIKTAQNVAVFAYKEIEYIFNLELVLENIAEIQSIHLTYINTSTKTKKENSEFTLSIYKKLENLNLIEKYIFANKLNTLKEKVKGKKDEKEELLRHYFKEFLTI